MKQKTEILSSKIKLFLMLIVSLIFIALGIKLAENPEQFISTQFRSIEFIKIAGIASVAFCGSILIYISIKLFDKKPGLIIDENGINDNSSAVSVGLILWKDIISIRTEKIKSTSFLIIGVNNPEKYIESSNKFKKILLKANLKMYGTPISISSNGLKYNFRNLESLIKTEFDKHKEKPNC